MAKANPIKLRKHAPYRKSFLIPLWILQLSLPFGISIYSGIDLHFDIKLDVDWPMGLDILFAFIQMLLNIFLTSSIIFVIIKFSRYTLTTKLFKIQSIIAVVLSGTCIVVYLATENWYVASFPGVAWLASIAICARVCVLRKRVQRGEAAEMKRRIKEVPGEEAKLEDGNKFRVVEREGVDLEDGNKFRGVEREVAIMSVAHHVPRLL